MVPLIKPGLLSRIIRRVNKMAEQITAINAANPKSIKEIAAKIRMIMRKSFITPLISVL